MTWLGGVVTIVGKSEGWCGAVEARLTAEKAVVLNWQIKTDNLTEDRVRNEMLSKRHPTHQQRSLVDRGSGDLNTCFGLVSEHDILNCPTQA